MRDALPADDGIGQTPGLLVAIHELLAHHIAVVEGHDARIAVETAVDDKAGVQPLMHGAEITHRIPYGVGMRIDRDVLLDRSHGMPPYMQTASTLLPSGSIRKAAK